jgi:hypothetical protein
MGSTTIKKVAWKVIAFEDFERDPRVAYRFTTLYTMFRGDREALMEYSKNRQEIPRMNAPDKDRTLEGTLLEPIRVIKNGASD